jgi:hypothetical protein
MADLNFALLPWQQDVYADKTRFKVVVAGRRCGKSRLAVTTLLIEGLSCPAGSAVLYVAPTQGQARQIIWDVLLDIGRDIIQSSHVNNMEVTLINGAKIYVRGSDRPDTLRGVSLTYAVLDEVADIKPETWEQVIRASLSDKKGRCMMIGTPKGRNWFYDLYNLGQDGSDPDWKSWHFTTKDNPLIDPSEIESAKKTLSSFAFKQEYMASFDNAGSDVFKEEWLKYGEIPEQGSYFIAVDLAGFEEVAKQAANSKKRLDQSAIAVVKVTEDGKWYVEKIEFGRWDIRTTAANILLAIREYRPMSIGIERGALKNAVLPYLSDLMRKSNIYAHIVDLTHGNRKKSDRIIWALQGRFEHGRIVLNKEEDWSEFVDQLLMYPSQGVHDDLCFVAGTLISTPCGNKPIETLKVGDWVDTPIGARQVIAAQLTNSQAQVYALNSGLVGTGGHPVMTNNGWKPLCEINKDDIIVYQHNKGSSWVSQLKRAWFVSRFTSMDTSTTVTQNPRKRLTASISPSLAVVGCFTGTFGSSTMEQYQTNARYTTKIRTTSITTFQTLSALASRITSWSILPKSRKEQHHQSDLSILPISGVWRLLGMGQQKDWLGIAAIVKSLGRVGLRLNILAKSAVQNLNPSRLQGFIIALVSVRQRSGGVNIQTITRLKARHPVYNLTVVDANCYYANGILVHNCDALSYIDQLSITSYFEADDEDEWTPVDIISGV